MEIYIKDDFIKLGQALKLSGLADDGVEAKHVIQEGHVRVNGETEERRGRKLYEGDIVHYNDQIINIRKN